MKEILNAIGQTIGAMTKIFVQIITLPCELLNISDYWAIAYTAIIAGIALLFGKRKS